MRRAGGRGEALSGRYGGSAQPGGAADFAPSRASGEAYIARGGTDAVAYDALAIACHRTGDDAAAKAWGERALAAKSQGTAAFALGEARAAGAAVIAFSLWGDNPRYLRGALHNVLVARLVYPGFGCRFMVDASVPADALSALAGEGAEVVRDEAEPSLRRRLTRRFLVADDPGVATYLVRDCDSVVSLREAAAVGEWLASGRPVHVMRDWWSHTDPMLAGMWGGRGGVLPPLASLIKGYRSRHVETANWDQWLLRDAVWPSVKAHAMIHDRCFASAGARAWPGSPPASGFHVGQDEFAVRREAQAALLAPFARTMPSLRL